MPQPCNLAIDTFEISGLKYYPNPVKDNLKFSADELISTITIYAVTGQKVIAATVDAATTILNVSNLPKGTYFVKIEATEKTKYIKFIKE